LPSTLPSASLARAAAVLLACGAPLSACQTPSGPDLTARRYASALREGELDEAYALLAADQRPSREAFLARYQDPAAREARAQEVEQGAKTLIARGSGIELRAEGGRWAVFEGAQVQAARAVGLAFVDAVERRDFEGAYALLGGELRARYTPGRLAEDFAAEPLAEERLARARAALATAGEQSGDQMAFPIGEGRAFRLHLEAAGFRVVALE
jgi:hypothetical protein